MLNKKVLIVDDDREILDAAMKGLGSRGCKVKTASDGSQAFEAAKSFKPDIILMDIIMEDMDGAQAVRNLQSEAQTSVIPVIFLSGIVSSEDKSTPATVKVNNREYPAIAKPFSMEDLVARIEEILGG